MSESSLLPDTHAARTQPAADTPAARPARRGRRLGAGVVCGLGVLVVLFAMAYVAPLIRPFSPNDVAGPPFAAPDGTNWLGTDDTAGVGARRLDTVLMSGVDLLLSFPSPRVLFAMDGLSRSFRSRRSRLRSNRGTPIAAEPHDGQGGGEEHARPERRRAAAVSR